MPHISDSEDARNIGLEKEWIAFQVPSLGGLPVAYQVRTSQEKTTLVPFHDIGKPIRARQCANKNKHRARRNPLHFASVGTKYGDFLQMGIPMRRRHTGVGPQLDVGSLLNLIDQILRHSAGS